jgi:protein-S-isoprenylcysteine O-methyltransferase Ste14
MNRFILMRTLVYASIFIGLLLIYVPARLLSWSGIVHPATMHIPQALGIIIGTLGAFLAFWCIFTFAAVGKGTPAPFDPPHRLVTRGPYHFVRNPMYIGAGLALAGASLFYESLFLLSYAVIFLLISHLFVIGYEEPTLLRTFGSEYKQYCRHVKRWRPRFRLQGGETT